MELEYLNNFRDKKILVIGDYCIDRFYYGSPNNQCPVSPEAPILRMLINQTKTNPGMTGNIALGINALEAKCYAVGIIGEDNASKDLIAMFKEKGINTDGMFLQKERITPEFSRIVARGKYPEQSLMRFDKENITRINEESTYNLIEFIGQLRNEIDAIIVADYDEVGNGVIGKELLYGIKRIRETRKNIIVIGDSRTDFEKFYGFTCIKPNLDEASRLGEIENASKIIEKLNLNALLITKDKDGMEIITKEGGRNRFPAYAQNVVDVTGAGDSVICAFTLGLSSGFDYFSSAQLSSYAAAISVSKPGVYAVTLNELKDFLENER